MYSTHLKIHFQRPSTNFPSSVQGQLNWESLSWTHSPVMTQKCTNSSHQLNITEEQKKTSAYNLPYSLSLCQDYHLVWHKRYH